MPIISSIHIHTLSDLQMDVRKHSAEEKIDKTIPGAAGEKKKICVKTESPASTGPPSSLFTGSQTDENSLQVMPNTGIQLENFDALILDICDYARAARNTPHVHA